MNKFAILSHATYNSKTHKWLRVEYYGRPVSGFVTVERIFFADYMRT